jgi:hypothetical protein
VVRAGPAEKRVVTAAAGTELVVEIELPTK